MNEQRNIGDNAKRLGIADRSKFSKRECQGQVELLQERGASRVAVQVVQ